MTDQENTAGFNVWLTINALQGITEALYRELTEGAASEASFDRQTHATLIGLSYAARRLARELNEYFRAASEAGLELPEIINGQFKGVEDSPPPPYRSVN
ncbi:MAG TPA: hypothetical protein VF275_00340 [Gammaproteobacteria bacterium]